MHLWKFQQVMLYCCYVILWYILFILFHLWQMTASNNILCSIVIDLLIILPSLFTCGFYVSKQQLSNWEVFALRNDHCEMYDVVATSNLRCLFHEVLELLWSEDGSWITLIVQFSATINMIGTEIFLFSAWCHTCLYVLSKSCDLKSAFHLKNINYFHGSAFFYIK